MIDDSGLVDGRKRLYVIKIVATTTSFHVPSSTKLEVKWKVYFPYTPVTLVTVRLLRCGGCVYLLDMINMDDNSGSGTGTKSALSTWRSSESLRLDSAVAQGTAQRQVSEATWRFYLSSPLKQTQKLPILIHAKRGKEYLVFKILAKTEQIMQSAPVHLQGIPGFPKDQNPLEHLHGA